MFNECLYIWLKTRLNLKSTFLDQNNLKSKHQGKNKLIYIRDEHVWTVAEINPLCRQSENINPRRQLQLCALSRINLFTCLDTYQQRLADWQAIQASILALITKLWVWLSEVFAVSLFCCKLTEIAGLEYLKDVWIKQGRLRPIALKALGSE